jgi:hypothetical protein
MDDEKLIYVGMSGRGRTAQHFGDPDETNRALGLWTRLNSHASGRRSGDQFCVYVCDRFVVPTLTREQQQAIGRGDLSLDTLTRSYIRDRLSYRFVATEDGTAARVLEDRLRRGELEAGQPVLNPLAR